MSNVISSSLHAACRRNATLAGLLLSLLAASSATAATGIRQNNTDTLDLGTAWSTGTPLTNADTALWDSAIDGSVAGANTTTVGAGAVFGAIQITNPAVLINIGAGTGPLTLGNTTIPVSIDMSAATVDLIVGSNVVLVGNQTWDIASARTLFMDGVLSGTGAGFVKTGTGTVLLSGSNTFTGPVVVNGGGVVALSNGALGGTGGGVTVANGAMLDIMNNITIGAEALNLSGTGISNFGALRSVSGNNSYAGAITLAADSLIVSASAGDTLTLTGNVNSTTGGRGLSFAGNGNINVNGTLGTNISSLTKNGTGSLLLNGASTRTGATTVNAGTLILGNANALQNSTLDLLGGGVNFGLLTTATFGGLSGNTGLALDESTPLAVALTVGGNGANTTYTGVLSGNGSLNKTGTGILTLGGANTYAGATVVSNGTLALDFSSAGAPASNILPSATLLTLNGTSLQVVGATGATNAQTLSGTTLNIGQSRIGVTQNGATAVNVDLGGLNRSAGALVDFTLPTVGNVNATTHATNGILTSAVAPDGVAYATVGSATWAGFNGTSVTAFNAYHTGTNPAAWTATDNVSLAANPDATLGNTTINTLRLTGTSAVAIGATESLTLGAGGLLVTGTGSNSISGGTLLGAGGLSPELVIIQNNVANPLVISSVIANNGNATALTKGGNGALTLNGANTYNGTTTLLAGTLNLGSATAIGNGALNIFGGTTLDNTSGASITLAGGGAKTFAGNFTFLGTNDLNLGAGAVTLTGNRTITVSASTLSIGGAIGGAGFSLTKAGNGVLALNAVNTFGGGLNISTGTVNLGIVNALPTTSPVTVADGALLNIGTFSQSIGSLGGTGNVSVGTGAALTINNAAASTVSANISGAGGVTKAGGGILTVSSVITTTGALNVNLGTLNIASGGGFANAGLVVIANATSNMTVSGNLNATGMNIFSQGNNTTVGGLAVQSGGNVLVAGNVTMNTTNGVNGNKVYLVVENGGNFTANNLLFLRNGGSSNSTAGGIRILGGNFTINDTLNTGAESHVAVLLSGGNLTASTWIAAQGLLNNARGSNVTISGGSLNITSSASGGLVMSLSDNATNKNQGGASTITVSGGVHSLAMLTLAPAGITNGTAVFNLTGGQVYIGAGGLVNNAASTFNGTVNLNGGTLGASADWTGNARLTLNGTTIRTADQNNNPFNITLAGVLAGTGALNKTGNGRLTLAGTNTYSGVTNITAGTIQIGNGGTTGTLGSNLTVNNSGTLAFNRSNTYTLAAAVNGTGGLHQLGNGTTSITSVNTYTGATSVTNGTLVTSGAGDINSTSGIVINGANATFRHGSSVALTAPVSFAGAGAFQNNAVYNGNLAVPASAALSGTGNVNGLVTVAPGGIIAPGTSVGALTVGSLTAANGSIFNYEFNLSPANDLLVVTDAGGLNLGAAGFNLYQEGTTEPWLSQGTYNLMQVSGTPTIDFANLTVLNPDITLSYSFQLSANLSFLQLVISSSALPNTWVATTGGSWGTGSNWSTGVPPANATAIFAGSIQNASTITLDGDRAIAGISISSPQSYTIAQGSSGNLTMDNGASAVAVDIAGAHTLSAPLTFGAAGLITNVGNSSTFNLTGNILATTGALTKAGNGDLVLTGTNAHSGGTNLNAGSIIFNAVENFGSGPLVFNGGALRWATGTSADISTQTLTFAEGGAVLNTNGNNVTLANAIGNGGPGALTKIGAGVLTLGGNNTYAGGTVIQQGGIQFSAPENFGPGNLTFNGGALIWAEGTSTDVSAIPTLFQVGGATFNTNGNNVTLSAAIGGGGEGSFAKTGNGTLTLGVLPSYAGATFVNAGTLAAGASNTLVNASDYSIAAGANLLIGTFAQTITGNVSGPGTVTVNAGGNLSLSGSATFSAALVGNGTLTKAGGGTLTLTGDNNAFTGPLTFTGGTLVIGPGAQMLNAGIINPTTTANAVLLVNGGDFATNVTANFSMAGGTGTAFQINAGNATFAALRGVTNSGGVRISINGGNTTASSIEIQRTSNDNPGPNFGSGLFVNGGNLTVTGNVALGTNASGAAIVQGGNMTVNGAVLVSNNNTGRNTGLQVTSGSLTITNATNGLVLVGSGPSNAVVTLSGGLSQIERISYGLNSTITSGNTGTLNLSGTGQLYVGAGGIVVNGVGMTSNFNISGGTLGALADWTGAAPMTLTGNTSVIRTADLGGVAHNITLTGNIGGTGLLTKTGNGILTLAGNNTYSGGTNLTAGTLQVGNGGANGSLGIGNVTNEGQIIFASAGNATVPGLISGNGSLLVNGPGSLTLTAENTFTGTVMVNGGTLNLSNAVGTALVVPVTVNAGGTVGGNGTLTGNVVVNTFGAVAPGSNGVGTLTLNSLNLAVGTALKFEFDALSLTNDLLVVTDVNGLNTAGTEVFLYKAGTTVPVTKAGLYDIIQFNGTLGGGMSNLTIGNEFYGFDYSLVLNGTTVQANVSVQNLPFSWTSPVDGLWSTAANWSGNIVPNGAGQLVNFLAINEFPVFVTLDGSRTVGGLVFASDVGYTISAGSGELTLNNNSSAANITAYVGNHTISAPLRLTANGAIANISAGSELGLLGNIGQTAAGALAKTGNGALVLAGDNTYSGGTTLSGGTLFLHSQTAIGTGPLTITGGTLANNLGFGISLLNNNPQNWNGDFSFAGPFDLDLGTGSVTLSDNRTVTVSAGVLSVGGGIGGGAFSLVKMGNGTLALNGVNTYSGGTAVLGGTLLLGFDNSLAATAPVIVSGGEFNMSFTSQAISTLHLVNGSVTGFGTLTAANNYDVQSGSISVNLAGNVGLVKTTTGTVTLLGQNVYTGATDIQNGNLVLTGLDPLPSGSVVTLSSPGNTALLTLGNANGVANVTLGSLVSGGGTGIVRGGNGNTSTLSIDVASGTNTLNFVFGDTAANGNNLQLVKTGNGLLALTGVNTYANGTIIQAGTLRVVLASGLGNASGGLTINNGTFEFDGVTANNTNRVVTLGDANSTIQVTNATFSLGATGTLAGLGNLNKTGPGILQLNSTNSTGFSGDTNIHAGTIVLGNALALQASTLNYDNQGGAISFGNLTGATLGGLKGAQSLALADNFALSVGNNNSDTTYTGVLSGNNASLTKVGLGSLTLTGNNTYTGNTLGNAGFIVFSALENLGQGTDITLNGGGLRWATGSVADISTRTVTFVGNGVLDTNGNNVTLANPIGNFGNGGLVKNGEGALTLHGANLYSGNTSVALGTLVLATGASISPFSNLDVSPGAKFDATLSMGLTVGGLSGGGDVAVGSGGAFAVGNSGVDTTFTGTLADTGGAGATLVKEGPGALNFGGTYSFGGQVSVNGGTLRINSSLPASTPVTINNGGTIGGTGTLGNVTVAAGGKVAPGASIGTLTVGNLTWNSDDLLSALWELSETDNTSDLLAVTGTLTKGAGTVFLFDFQGTGYFNGGETVYTLVTFTNNVGFTTGDFAYQNLGPNLSATFQLNANNLQLIVVPEPSTWALLAGCAVLGFAALRRRRNRR